MNFTSLKSYNFLMVTKSPKYKPRPLIGEKLYTEKNSLKSFKFLEFRYLVLVSGIVSKINLKYRVSDSQKKTWYLTTAENSCFLFVSVIFQISCILLLLQSQSPVFSTEVEGHPNQPDVLVNLFARILEKLSLHIIPL